MADPGTLSGELQGKLGLEASENSIFQKLTSKIGPNSNFATFTKKSKNWNCTKNWLVIGMKLKFSGNAYLIDSNNDENFKEIEEPSMTALGDLDWNDPILISSFLWFCMVRYMLIYYLKIFGCILVLYKHQI